LQACNFAFWLIDPYILFAVAEYMMCTLWQGILNFGKIFFMKEISSSLSL
jgi:hypothetical protein